MIEILFRQGYHHGIYKEEDKTCEYLEVNKVIESTELRNWTPRKGKSIINFNWCFLQLR